MAFAKYMEEIRVFLTEKGLITLFALHVVFEHEKCLTCNIFFCFVLFSKRFYIKYETFSFTVWTY